MLSAENLLKDSFLLSLCKYTFLLIIQTKPKTPNLIEAQIVHFGLTTYNCLPLPGTKQVTGVTSCCPMARP